MSLGPDRWDASTGTGDANRSDRPGEPWILQLQGVHTHIGAFHILQGVDFAVKHGEVFMLLGRNGAGKTTTLRTIMGFWKASAGSILFEGSAISRLSTTDVARLGVAYVPENMGIFPHLSVRDNMLLAARQAGSTASLDTQRLQRIVKWFPPIERFWLAAAGTLSGGQKQMLAIGRAIIEERKLLIVDEPSKGLAPAIVENLLEAFMELRAEGQSILMVEQNFALAKRLGDRVAVMDSGRISYNGPMRALVDDESLQDALLGLDLGQPAKANR